MKWGGGQPYKWVFFAKGANALRQYLQVKKNICYCTHTLEEYNFV